MKYLVSLHNTRFKLGNDPVDNPVFSLFRINIVFCEAKKIYHPDTRKITTPFEIGYASIIDLRSQF